MHVGGQNKLLLYQNFPSAWHESDDVIEAAAEDALPPTSDSDSDLYIDIYDSQIIILSYNSSMSLFH